MGILVFKMIRNPKLLDVRIRYSVSDVEFRRCGCANFNEYDEGHNAQSLSNARGNIHAHVARLYVFTFLILLSGDSSLRLRSNFRL